MSFSFVVFSEETLCSVSCVTVPGSSGGWLFLGFSPIPSVSGSWLGDSPVLSVAGSSLGFSPVSLLSGSWLGVILLSHNLWARARSSSDAVLIVQVLGYVLVASSVCFSLSIYLRGESQNDSHLFGDNKVSHLIDVPMWLLMIVPKSVLVLILVSVSTLYRWFVQHNPSTELGPLTS